MVDDGDESGSESSDIRWSVQGQGSISMTNLGDLMSQLTVGREDLDGVAAGVRDEKMASVVHVQSRRSREILDEHPYFSRHQMDLKDAVTVEVGDIEILACKDKNVGH